MTNIDRWTPYLIDGDGYVLTNPTDTLRLLDATDEWVDDIPQQIIIARRSSTPEGGVDDFLSLPAAHAVEDRITLHAAIVDDEVGTERALTIWHAAIGAAVHLNTLNSDEMK